MLATVEPTAPTMSAPCGVGAALVDAVKANRNTTREAMDCILEEME